jgi:hypothetical protein
MAFGRDDQPRTGYRKRLGERVFHVDAIDLKVCHFGCGGHCDLLIESKMERRVHGGLAEIVETLLCLSESSAHSAFKSLRQQDRQKERTAIKPFAESNRIDRRLFLFTLLVEVAFHDRAVSRADGAFPGLIA